MDHSDTTHRINPAALLSIVLMVLALAASPAVAQEDQGEHAADKAEAAAGAAVEQAEAAAGEAVDQVEDAAHFDLARPLAENPAVARLTELARQLEVVLPVSFFERANQAFYNTVAVIDADDGAIFNAITHGVSPISRSLSLRPGSSG